MIGGEGIIVEINESKFHNPGRTDDPHKWGSKLAGVFGGIERIAERHVFVEHVCEEVNQPIHGVLVIIHHRVHLDP